MPRHWDVPWEDYDEDLEEVIEWPGSWVVPYTEHDYTRLQEWPDSTSGPTRRASEWITNNKKDKVAA